jgi:hypothetical protein
MNNDPAKAARWLWASVFVNILLCAVVLFLILGRTGIKRFEEIDVERINIVEKDGSTRMVISNKDRSPGPIQRGQPFGYPGGTRAGMIYYNDEGTENGGLIFSGKREEGKVTAVGSLTFDQYEQDQTIALQYVEDSGKRRAGLMITDYPTTISAMELYEKLKAVEEMPEGPTKTEAQDELRKFSPKFRMYIGRGRSGSSLLELADAQGKTRLRLEVDMSGAARIQFLDENGQVTFSLPESGKAR